MSEKQQCANASGGVLTGSELRLAYDSNEPVIEDVTIQIQSCSTVGLIGPNGCGKSTLLRGLSQKLSPKAGRVVLDGSAIDEYGTKELARKLGFLSQQRPSPEGITVEELVEYGRYPHQGFFEGITEEDRAAIEQAIESARLGPIRDRTLKDLSGGQQQLAWIGMCLAQNSEILLVDEPLTHLDLRNQLLVLDVLTSLESRTVVTALHDLQSAARFADTIVALKDGTIYDQGDPESVLTESLLADVFGVNATVARIDGKLQLQLESPIEQPN